MKAAIHVLTIVLLLSACAQTDPLTQYRQSGTVDGPASDPSNTELEPSTRDSIDKENNESVVASGDNITKAVVRLTDGDSTISLTAYIRKDHRIFGYAGPDTNSERLLLLSIFTNDVQNNPFGCTLGAYYDTIGMGALTLKYSSTNGTFVKAHAIDKAGRSTPIYFERKWIVFE